MDLVKTRLQSRNSPFRNVADIVRHVAKEQGISGLWTGTTPSVVRLEQVIIMLRTDTMSYVRGT